MNLVTTVKLLLDAQISLPLFFFCYLVSIVFAIIINTEMRFSLCTYSVISECY